MRGNAAARHSRRTSTSTHSPKRAIFSRFDSAGTESFGTCDKNSALLTRTVQRLSRHKSSGWFSRSSIGIMTNTRLIGIGDTTMNFVENLPVWMRESGRIWGANAGLRTQIRALTCLAPCESEHAKSGSWGELTDKNEVLA